MRDAPVTLPEPGHNRGPSLAAGKGWQAHCWRAARENLLPILPVEVVRLRVRRAAELGLDYKTYAGVRATTGRDLVAFLFSSNALGLVGPAPGLPSARATRLGLIRGCGRIALAQSPQTPATLRPLLPEFDACHHAPGPFDSEGRTRATLRAALGRHPADAVLLIGEAPWERDWCAAVRLAGYLPAERFFAPA